METLKFKPMELLLMAILTLAISSCNLIDKAAIQYLECQGYELCDYDGPQDPLSYALQAQTCGGAADTFGDEYTDEQCIKYHGSDLDGDGHPDPVWYHRFLFVDSVMSQVFTTKYLSFNQHLDPAEGFIVPYNDPNREEFYKLEIMEEVATSDPNVVIGLCHQHKECPGLPPGSNCNFAAHSYPDTPAKIPYCVGDFQVGDFLGLVVEFN